MKFLVDECLSPRIASRLKNLQFDAIHPRDRGWQGQQDHTILKHAYEEDRTIVTANAEDFRKLVGRLDLHPGLIILPNVGSERGTQLLETVIAFVRAKDNPSNYLVNRVIEVGKDGAIKEYELSRPDSTELRS